MKYGTCWALASLALFIVSWVLVPFIVLHNPAFHSWVTKGARFGVFSGLLVGLPIVIVLLSGIILEERSD